MILKACGGTPRIEGFDSLHLAALCSFPILMGLQTAFRVARAHGELRRQRSRDDARIDSFFVRSRSTTSRRIPMASW